MASTFHTLLLERVLELLPDKRPLERGIIENVAIPENIRFFILRVLERRVSVEEASFEQVSSDWFDLSAPAVTKSFRRYLDRVRSTARIPAAETIPMISQAVEHISGYVERPVGTLLDFMFQNESASIATHSALRRAQYFTDYSHLILAVSAYIEKEKIDQIDRSELRKALEAVDRAITVDYSGQDWVEHLSPLLALHAFGGQNPDRIGLDRIVHSFRDRGRKDLADALLRIASRSAEEHRADLDDPVENEVESGGALIPHTALGPLIQGAIDLEIPAEDVDVPLWKRFAGDVETDTRLETAGEERSRVPLWKTFAETNQDQNEIGPDRGETGSTEPMLPKARLSASGQEESPPTQSRFEQIEERVLGDARHRSPEFLTLLFNGQVDTYHTVISSLSSAQTWADASRIIGEHVFLSFSTDIYSEIAIAFTDAVEHRFKHD